MNSEQFCYWLQGYGELNSDPPSAEQWQSIREHLQLVFKKETPPLNTPRPAYQGLELQHVPRVTC